MHFAQKKLLLQLSVPIIFGKMCILLISEKNSFFHESKCDGIMSVVDSMLCLKKLEINNCLIPFVYDILMKYHDAPMVHYTFMNVQNKTKY